MKKSIFRLGIVLLLCALCAGALLSCGTVKFELNFKVDGETYDTITTAGGESISMPKNPTKEGYIFEGWYWDEGTWQRPFTVNSLLDVPLSSDMSVYAHFISRFPAGETDGETGGETGGDSTVTADKTITGVTLTDKTVTYSGAAQSLTVTGTLPEGVACIYTYNGTVAASATEVGTYTVVATLSGEGYKTLTLRATLTIIDNYQSADWWDNVNFGNKELKIQISNAVDNELTPGGDKYMKGPSLKLDDNSPDATGFEKVSNAVYERNLAAANDLGVKLTYTYCDEGWSYVWGFIREKENSGNAPDMYCDMMYDMVAASLETTPKCFTNIYKYTTENEKYLDGYVGGYFDISDEKGYYTGLMSDMALSDDKCYLIASDYYIDVLRAVLLMPFNKDMYVSRVNQNDPDCIAFYDLVEDGDWTWDKLMEFKSVYGSDQKPTLDSHNLLMALSHGGLTATGLLYSTAFTNYKETYTGDRVSYKLDTSCAVINDLFAKAYEIVCTDGVVCDSSTSGDVTGVIAVKNAFTAGRALFAGPQMLGVIEEENFRNMTGLGIVPVPKLSTIYEYNTAVNTRARVGAISFSSTSKREMSALIQYMTENSTEMKNEYFNGATNGKYLQGSADGRMLDLIEENMASNKSMILDGLVMARNWADCQPNVWTELIKDNFFKGNKDNINTLYQSAVGVKQTTLNKAVEDWYNCD